MGIISFKYNLKHQIFMEDQRTPVYFWNDLDSFKKNYCYDLSEEELDAILDEVRKEFKVREGCSVKESNKQFLNKVDARVREIIEKRN